MAEGRAQCAQHGGVGQVALPAADRQLVGEVVEQGIGDAEIALGVFKINGIDLVRHGRTADFAFLQCLLEITLRNVAPDIAAEVDQDDVDAALGIAEFGDAVVRLDLRGVGVPFQAQRLDEALRQRVPVDVGVGRDVGIEVANRAVDLARDGDGGQLCALALQARDDVGHFLAQRGRRSRLAVRARQHGLLRLGVGQSAQLVDHRVGFR